LGDVLRAPFLGSETGRAQIFLVFVADLLFLGGGDNSRTIFVRCRSWASACARDGADLPYGPRWRQGQPDSREVALPRDESG